MSCTDFIGMLVTVIKNELHGKNEQVCDSAQMCRHKSVT